MKKTLLKLLIFFGMYFTLSSISAQDYYVSALTGNNNNDGLTPGTAVATISKGAEKVNAGGTVFIMNGTYTRTTFGNILNLTKSGTPNAYITFKPYPGHNPIISASGGAYTAVIIDGSYVLIEGLEFKGDNENLTYADAYQAYLDYINRVKGPQGKYNTNAISFGRSAQVHHVIFRNLKIHDWPAGGVGGGRCDYITIEGCTIYNTSWYTMYATSAISFLTPRDIDLNTGYKLIVRNNKVYNNKTLVPWERTRSLSDGNGIILDVNRASADSTRPAYIGRTLVENNVSYNNGGGGIHAYNADHIDIINNTAYNNGTVVGYPEIDAQQCTDVKIYNNIMYARTGGRCNGNDGGTYNYNAYFNGPAFKLGANDVFVNPEFVNLAIDSTADFRLKSSSPVINTGSMIAGQFATNDIVGLPRPSGSRTDKGAYEYQSGTAAQTIVFPDLPLGKKSGDSDYDPGATATSGLPVIYKSSNLNVATIVDGKIRFENQGTTTITASQNGDATFNSAPDVTKTLTVLNDGFRVADLPVSSINGLDYSYYEDNWTILPDFATLTPVKTGATTIGVDLNLSQRKENFGLTFKGFVDVPANGIYTFYLSSDDGSRLYIGDSLIVDNDGLHVGIEKSGTIGLKKGKHAITIKYFNASGSNLLSLSYSSLTLPKTVIPVSSFYRANPNLVSNPTFDENTTGWSLPLSGGAVATLSQVVKEGFSGNAAKVINTSTTTNRFSVQLRTRVPLVKDYTYAIRFRASADAARNIDVMMQQDAPPYAFNYTRYDVALNIAPAVYTYTFTAPRTDNVNFLKFLIGSSNTPVYIDDVEVVRVFSPEIVVKQDSVEIADNTGNFNFGDVTVGVTKTVKLTIQNTGNNILNLTGNPRISITGTGFDLVADAAGTVDTAGNTTFDIKFNPNAVKPFTGTLSITNNDFNESVFNFALSGTGVKDTQTITFNSDSAAITYGDANTPLIATSSSGLPVSFAVISGPGAITNGTTLSYTGAGEIVIEATQAGDSIYNAADTVRRSITISKKELLITADNKTVSYGDSIPPLTYTVAGFVYGQTDSVLTGSPELSTTYTPATPSTASPVAIVVSAGTLAAANYTFGFVNGEITILPTTLPAQLSRFTANVDGNISSLNWETLQETNADKFIVERSLNGKEFLAIGEVNGYRNSTDIKIYTFKDKSPVKGANYYRLKQVDFDGKIRYSGTSEVNFTMDVVVLTIYPNPVADVIYISGLAKQKFNSKLYDSRGKVILRQAWSSQPTIKLPTLLQPGIYLLELNLEGGKKFIKKIMVK